MSNCLEKVEKLKGVVTAANGVNAERAVPMRFQKPVKTGLDAANIVRRDVENYEADTLQFTQSLGVWCGFIGQQTMIAIKKQVG